LDERKEIVFTGRRRKSLLWETKIFLWKSQRAEKKKDWLRDSSGHFFYSKTIGSRRIHQSILTIIKGNLTTIRFAFADF
jgi:hypothetical protein